MTNEELCLLAQDGNSKAISSLLECILPGIRITAEKMQKHFSLLPVDTDDLVQEAMLGILRAVQTFQQEKDILFLTFASSVAKTCNPGLYQEMQNNYSGIRTISRHQLRTFRHRI